MSSAPPNTELDVMSEEMALLSNMLAAYSFIAEQPERAGLVFLGGVAIGLLVTLCAIVFQIHCRADCRYGNSKHHRHRARRLHGDRRPCPLHHHQADAHQHALEAPPPHGDGQSDDDRDDPSSRRRRRFERTLLHASMFTSAEDLDRAQRLEERERILREIWMNGQPDISTVTQSLNRYY